MPGALVDLTAMGLQLAWITRAQCARGSVSYPCPQSYVSAHKPLSILTAAPKQP